MIQQGSQIGDKHLVKLTLNCPHNLIEKIEHLSQLRSQPAHKGECAAVLEEAVGMMIDKIDPAKKAERALSRKRKQQETSPSQNDGTEDDCTAAVTGQRTDKIALVAEDSAADAVPSANTFPASACDPDRPPWTDRIDFLATVVKDAFGYVPTRISGAALPPEEASNLDSHAAEENSELECLGYDGSAAMPASRD